MNYDVTIGIPVYNSAPFIIQSLESALSQSYLSVEFLIIDDGSSDGTISVVKQFLDQHSRKNDVHIISHAVNHGVSTARNEIIDKAQGDYLYFMDSDDTIAPNTIEIMMKHIRQFDVEIVFGSYVKRELSGGETPFLYPLMIFHRENEFASFAYRKLGGIQASACNYLVSISLLRNNNIRFINVDFWEDLVFTFELVTYITKAVLLPEITYHYISRNNSLSQIQHRIRIPKEEIMKNVATVDYLKQRTLSFYNKEYFPSRCYCVMMMDLYVAIYVLRHRKTIVPYVSDSDIQKMMSHPARLSQIVHFHEDRVKNLVLFLL